VLSLTKAERRQPGSNPTSDPNPKRTFHYGMAGED